MFMKNTMVLVKTCSFWLFLLLILHVQFNLTSSSITLTTTSFYFLPTNCRFVTMKFALAFKIITAVCLFSVLRAERREEVSTSDKSGRRSSSRATATLSPPHHFYGDNKTIKSDDTESSSSTTINNASLDDENATTVHVAHPHRHLQADWSLDFVSSGISPDEWYGGSVVLSKAGDRFVIGGAYGYVPPGSGQTNAGKVEVYDLINGSWTLVKEWVGNDRDQFGRKVSISDDGKRIAATIPGDNSGQMFNFDGRVIVWEETNGSWTQVGEKAFAPSVSSVALSGDGKRFVTGSSKASHPYNRVARVYEEVNSVWTQLVEIEGNTLEESFAINGVGMSYDGKQFIGGAPYTSNNPNNMEGAGARVFREDTSGVWTQVGSDISSPVGGTDPPHSRWYGYCADISNDGETVIVGEPGENTIEIFNLDASGWQQSYDYTNTQAYRLGYSCAISQDGKSFAAGSTTIDIGTAVGKQDTSGNWMVEDNLGPESLGDEVAISHDGKTVGIGNKLVNNKTGSAAIYSKEVTRRCKDSELILQLQTIGGSTIPFLCELAKMNMKYTSCGQVLASHCPKTCGKQKEYCCSDSEGDFVWRDKVRNSCAWLAAKDPAKIEQMCKNKRKLRRTCRATCKMCDRG